MSSPLDCPIGVELVLPTVLRTLQKAVTEGTLERNPCSGCGVAGAPPCDHVEIVVVPRELCKRIQAGFRFVGCSEIDCIITFANVKSAAVNGNRIDDRRDQKIRVRIPIAM